MDRSVNYVIIIIHLFILSVFLAAHTHAQSIRYLVKAQNSRQAPVYERHFSEKGLKFLNKYPQAGIQVWESEENSRSAALELAELCERFPYLTIEREQTYELFQDPNFYKQSHLQNTGQENCIDGIDIGARNAWAQSTGESTFIIVVIDGGMDMSHEDLHPNLWSNQGETGLDSQGNDKRTNGIDDDGNGYIDDVYGWNFAYDRDTLVNGVHKRVGSNKPCDDTGGHGTHVAGIAGAKGNNGKGGVGVAWNCRIIPLKFTDSTGLGSTSKAIRAIKYAIEMKNRGENIVVINNSWGGGGASDMLKEAIEEADAAGILFVAAAGNDHSDNDRTPFYPASYEVPNIISVGSIDCRGELASHSNFGANSVDILAPGEGIYSTLPNNTYGFNSGTSMAAPQVSGAILLMKQQYPNDDIYTLKRKLLQNGRSDRRLQGKCRRGAILDIGRAIAEKSFWGQELQEGIPWAIVKSNDFLWAGTAGRGLIRHDLITSEKRIFTKDNSGLPSNNIWAIELIADTCLWIGTDKGLAKYCGGAWEVFDISNSQIEGNDIRDIVLDTVHNLLWLGTYDRGLISYDFDTTWNHFDNRQITQLEPSYDGNLWAVIQNTGFQKFNTVIKNWNLLIDSSNSELPSNTILNLSEGQDSSLWVLPNNIFENLLRYKDSRWDSLDIPDSINNGWLNMRAFEVAKDGTLWISSFEKLVRYHDGTWNLFLFDGIDLPNMSSANTSISIGDMYIDAEGDIWIGTPKGVVEFNGSLLNHFSHELPIPFTFISDIITEPNGKIWLSTSPEGLISKEGDIWERIDQENSPNFDATLYSLALSPNNTLWIGTSKGLIKYTNNHSLAFDRTDDIFFDQTITDIAVVSDTLLWISTQGAGFASFNGEELLKKFDANSFPLPHNFIESFVIHPDGHLWIMNRNHLTKFDGVDQWQVFPDNTTPWQNAMLSALAISSNGNVWVGTKGSGLWNYTTNNNWQIIRPDILGSAEINCLEPDENGNLWIGTEDGLYKYDGVNVVLHNENTSQLPSSKILALEIAPDGTLWAGTERGLAQIIPDSIASFTLQNTNICLGDSTIFQNTGLQGDSLTWVINDEIISRTQDLTYTFSEAGRYEVELNVYTDVDTSTYAIYVNVQTPIEIDLGPDTTATTRAVLLSMDLPSIAKHTWMNISGDTLGTSPWFSAKSSGHYILSVQDRCGAETQDIIHVDFVETATGYPEILPGDVNGDGFINGLDIILMSFKNGIEGTERECPDTTCSLAEPQPTIPWENSSPEYSFYTQGVATGTNLAYADANGDGIIDILTDAEVIRTYANSVHPACHQGSTSGDSICYEARDAEVKVFMELLNREVNIGQEIGFRFYLDGKEEHLADVHGIALSLDMNMHLSREPELHTQASLLGTPGEDMYQTYIYDRQSQRLDFVFTRLPNSEIELSARGRGVGGGGTIAVIEDIDTTRIRANEFPLTLTLGNVLVLDKDGYVMPANPVSIQRTHTVMVKIPPNTAIVRLTDFRLACEKEEQFVTWTAWEKNIKSYELQHSLDGERFESVNILQGQANDSAMKRQYEWLRAEDGPAYYRLKIIGKNGEIYYSDIILPEPCTVSIDNNLAKDMFISRLYPNPTQRNIRLNINFPYTAAFRLDLFNFYGQLLYSAPKRLGTGEHLLDFDASHLPTGLYWARLGVDGKLIRTEKILLRR